MSKILIVENEGLTAQDIESIVSRLGHRDPIVAYTGEDAIRKARDFSPELIIMDIMLDGGMDGIEAAVKINAMCGSPVIFITAYTTEDLIERAKTARPYGFIIKPYKEREVEITISMALHRLSHEKRPHEAPADDIYQSLVEATGLAIFRATADAYGVVMNASSAMARLLGYPHPPGCVGLSLQGMFTGPGEWVQIIEKLKVNSPLSATEVRLIRQDGSEIICELDIALSYGEDGVYANGSLRDISGVKGEIEKLRSLSFIDDLTGLYNRRGFTEFAARHVSLARRRKAKIVILCVDIDGLKMANDLYGHREGDALIIKAASVLREVFRNTDVIARTGGDEFLALLIDTDQFGIDPIYGRLHKTLSRYNAGSEPRRKLSLSYGAVEFDPASTHSLEEMIEQADAVMYDNKKMKKY